MWDAGAKRRILDRSRHLTEFVLRGTRYISGAVDPIPLRERCAFNVVSQGLCRLVDRVGAKIGYRLSDGCPRTSALGFWTVSSNDLERKSAIAIEHDDPFNIRTPQVVLCAVL